MKKLLTVLVALLALFVSNSLPAAVTDGVTLTGCVDVSNFLVKTGRVKKCTIHWANDTGTDIGPTAVSLPAGYILRWKTVPSVISPPTAAYDPKILEDSDTTNGLSLIQNMDDRSATKREGGFVLHGSAFGLLWQDGVVYVHVSGLTDGSDDEGDIVLWVDLEKSLAR